MIVLPENSCVQIWKKVLRKNISQGNGKARATGFAIPVLGCFPKIFLDAYIIKCKLQMTMRLLDTGTECSLRICIGKPLWESSSSYCRT
jgi:hypothetical protein